jgi:hypothetical protein
MANPKAPQQDRNQEVPGDTDAADIVGRTGEQMPQQGHDGLEADDRTRPSRADDPEKSVRTTKP